MTSHHEKRTVPYTPDQLFDLVADVETTEYSANPGDSWVIPTTVTNAGNGPDRYDIRLGRVYETDSQIDVLWDIDIPRSILTELSRGTSQTVDITVNVPSQVPAGDYTVVIQTFSEEDYPDDNGKRTRLRAETVLQITVNEFYDMQISMDPSIDNAVKTSAPGRIVEFVVNVTNAGNVPDTPSLHNHTASKDPSTGSVIWNTLPGMGSLSDWRVDWKVIRYVGDLVVEAECVVTTSDAEEFPDDTCVYLEDIDEWRLPEMDPYTTHTMIATVHIATGAKLDTRDIGLKVTSMAGNMENDGDHDDSPEWAGELLDTNELIVTLRLRAPNLVIYEVSATKTSNEVGSTLPVRVVLQNTGNVHATNIEVVLCEFGDADDEVMDDIKKNGCPEDSIVSRQTIGALLAPDASEEAQEIELYLLYPVSAGSHDVVVVVDPSNSIVEVSESDNIRLIETELSSDSPFLDVAGEIISDWALPFGVLLLTFSLFGVLYLVGKGRRADVKSRLAEQSSLISVLQEDEN